MDETRNEKFESLARIFTEVMAAMGLRTVIVCIPTYQSANVKIASTCRLDLAIRALQAGQAITETKNDGRLN